MTASSIFTAGQDRSGLNSLLGRNALSETLKTAKGASSEGKETRSAEGDTVEISARAPKPMDRSFLAEAIRVAERMGQGAALTQADKERMKSDPAFAATTALFLFQDATRHSLLDRLDNGSAAARPSIADLASQHIPGWPKEDAPAPAPADLAEMLRRFSQRLPDDSGIAAGPDALQDRRREILDWFRGLDLTAVSAALAADA